MALPRKKLRQITVNNKSYGWIASGNDGYINLYIQVLNMQNQVQILTATFNYHGTYSKINNQLKVGHQFVITPYAVKQVIEYALENGWTPAIKKPQMNLGKMDDKVDWKHNRIL